jgi:hypothetical protein
MKNLFPEYVRGLNQYRPAICDNRFHARIIVWMFVAQGVAESVHGILIQPASNR